MAQPQIPFRTGETILFQGDSITDAGRRDAQSAPLGNGYVAILRGLLITRYPQLKLAVLNRGIGGDRTAELLRRWNDDALALKPDWLSLMIGVNDVWRKRGEWQGQKHIPLPEFKANCESLLKQAAESGIKHLVLMSPTTIDHDPESELNRLLGDYAAVTRELAEKYRAIYVPAQEKLWAAIKSLRDLRWTGDGCHPTVAGHAVLAAAWLEAVTGA